MTLKWSRVLVNVLSDSCAPPAMTSLRALVLHCAVLSCQYQWLIRVNGGCWLFESFCTDCLLSSADSGLVRHSGSCGSDGLILFLSAATASVQTVWETQLHCPLTVCLTSLISVNQNELKSDQCCWMTWTVDSATWNNWVTALLLLCLSIIILTLSLVQSSIRKPLLCGLMLTEIQITTQTWRNYTNNMK